MMLGPWYVGDTPTTALVISVQRDNVAVELDGYATATVILHGPDGGLLTWASSPTIDTGADTVNIPPPSVSPFPTPGTYALYIRLATAGGAAETFLAAAIGVFTLATWPPTLDELKTDMKIDLTDTRDDVRLAQVLDASIDYVQRVRSDVAYSPFDTDLPAPTRDMRLGTLRLAARWHLRRRSPDGMISMAELGATRVSTYDNDIDRLLRIGRHQKMRVG
jgi:hypothetical protein